MKAIKREFGENPDFEDTDNMVRAQQTYHEEAKEYSIQNVYEKNKEEGLSHIIKALEQLLGRKDHAYGFKTCLTILYMASIDYRFPIHFEAWEGENNLRRILQDCVNLSHNEDWLNSDDLYYH